MSDIPVDLSNASDEEVERQIRQDFGYLAGFLAIPDIRNILFQAARDRWDQARLQGAIFATPWYQAHSQSQRERIARQNLDPASDRLALQQRVDEVTQLWIGQGGQPDDQGRVLRMAEDSLTFGWTPEQILRSVTAELDYAPGRGQVGASAEDIREMYMNYGVAASEEAIVAQAKAVASGVSTADAIQADVRTQAKALYQNPELHRAIDGGLTTRQFAEPWFQFAATELGVSPTSMSLMDPKWSRLIQPKEDGRAPSLLDVQRLIRQDPQYGFDRGPVAVQMAANLAQELGQRFGSV